MPDRPLVPAALARGARGAVVAPHHLATQAGLDVLRSGGHAVDAAIAANAALAVVTGYSCGLGGDAFWLVWDAGRGMLDALNGSGRSAGSADPERLRSAGLRSMPFRGPLAITVPGAVRSWSDAHARYGRLERTTLLAPAIELAADGFAADDGFIRAVETAAAICDAELGRDGADGFHRTYRPHGRRWRDGERVRLPALAGTLERMAAAGFDDFYDGELAERQARGLALAGCGIDREDLAGHRSTWTDPIRVDYRGTSVASHPPNSSGVVALEILAILAQFEAPPPIAFEPRDHGALAGADARWLHLTIEATRLAFADRDERLTDPDFADVDVEGLLDDDRIRGLAATIDPDRAALAEPAGAPRGGGTISLSVVDADGNVVSLIQSNYMGFGSGVVDPDTGIGYQNRGAYFSLEPDHPNVLAPRKRTLHTLLPWMVFRGGRPWVVGGSMGGDAQPAICAEVVSGIVDGRLDVASAVAAPRAFADSAVHFGPRDRVRIEPRFGADVLDDLRARGHRLEVGQPFDSGLGHCHAIELVDGGPATGGTLAAATDPRSQGLPATW